MPAPFRGVRLGADRGGDGVTPAAVRSPAVSDGSSPGPRSATTPPRDRIQ